MFVKDVAALAAENMGREDLAKEARTLAGAPTGELASLLRCYNLVENELALDYFPLKKTEEFLPHEQKIYYALFSRAPVDILRAEEEGGKETEFSLYPEYLLLSSPAEKKVKLTYTYSPKEKEWDEECEVAGKISERLLSFGVACEFCLSRGQFAESATWEKRYSDALRAAHINRRRLRIRSRRWV